MIRKGIRPELRIQRGWSGKTTAFRRTFAFPRPWVAIVVLLMFDLAFLLPAVSTLLQAIAMWQKPDELFSLVGALFLSFWLLGWSLAPLLMTAILLVMLFGREVLSADRGRVELSLGLPFLCISQCYAAASMRNLRLVQAEKKTGRSWRGTHAVFDYGANTVAFGVNLEERTLAKIQHELERGTGVRIRSGDAPPEQLLGDWEPGSWRGKTLVQTAVSAAPAQPAAREDRAPTLWSPSTLVLIAANLVPLLGTLLWDWNLGAVLVLYWAESGIIGLFNIAKMAVIGRWMAVLAGPFFLGHFGGFMAVHFLFLYTLFIKGPGSSDPAGTSLDEVALLFTSLWPALLALFLSHGYSFFSNFLGRQEYRQLTLQEQMSRPYSRVIFMHLVLIFGGGLSLFLGGPTIVLMIVIVLKVFVDVRAHLKERSLVETGVRDQL